MLSILSPAKTLDFNSENKLTQFSTPQHLEEAKIISQILKKKSEKKLKTLFKVSDKIAQENYERFQNWSEDFKLENSKQAILAYNGYVFENLQSDSFSEKDLKFAQDNLRILDAFYGILKPLDLIQPYRLEMQTSLKVKRKSLYEFWRVKFTQNLNDELAKHTNRVLLNLASGEYFKTIDTKKFQHKILNLAFKEEKEGKLKVVAVFAKMARGQMVNFIVKNKIDQVEKLKEFEASGYKFQAKLSTESEFVFVRKS
ncbi:MAG: peroxide stress protein YaaA [Calditrichaeota bacterium]|nr:MAG: peroxide stress protein YaaA [Calditrichota bacterium]